MKQRTRQVVRILATIAIGSFLLRSVLLFGNAFHHSSIQIKSAARAYATTMTRKFRLKTVPAIGTPALPPEWVMPMKYWSKASKKPTAGTDVSSDNRILKVLLFGPARGGTSLTGHLLSELPNSFYYFEPIGLLQASMASDNWWLVEKSFEKGRFKLSISIPRFRRAQARILERIFTCHLRGLPWDFLSSQHLVNMKEIYLKEECQTASNEVVDCRRELDEGRQGSNTTVFANAVIDRIESDAEFNAAFYNRFSTSYTQCVSEEKLRKCFSYMEELCTNSKTRTVKLIQTEVTHVQEISIILNGTGVGPVHVIQLVRDPRAVTVSRCLLSWFGQTCNTQEDLVAHTKHMCAAMDRDIEDGAQLDRFLLVYEHLVENNIPVIDRILQWLGKNQINATELAQRVFPQDVSPAQDAEVWGVKKSNPLRTANAFRSKFSDWAIEQVASDAHCSLVFRHYGFT